jgi:hypothetical protein
MPRMQPLLFNNNTTMNYSESNASIFLHAGRKNPSKQKIVVH